MKKTLLLLMSFICCQIICHAQVGDEHYYFKNLSVQNGLSQNTVNTILQDKQGFMWFGTKDGLNRYDGLSFRKFKHDDRSQRSIGNNFITALYEDAKGKIWVGTDVGLYVYDPEKDSFWHFTELSMENTKIEHTVTAISGDNQGCVWVAVESQGLFCYELETGELHNHTLEDFSFLTTNIQTFVFDNSGTLWIGCYGDGLFYSKDRLKTLHPYLSPVDNKQIYANDAVICLVKGAYNCLYVGSSKGGVKELNLTSNKLSDLLSVDESGESVFCRELLIASDHELWIGTESGLYIYNLRTGKYVHLRSSINDPYSLSDNAIYSLCKDREGGVWIGSYFGGVNYYPRFYTKFDKYYPKGTENGLHGKRVREFCMDNQGTLWIGTEDGGLNRFNPKTRTFSFFEPSSAFTNVHGLCMVGDNLWVGTFSKGVKVVDTRTGAIVKTYQKTDSPRSLNDNSVFSICRTTTGDVYLGTLFGLLCYNKQSDDFDQITELNGRFVYDIKEDSRGNIWLATYANGVYCYNVSEKKWKNYLHEDDDPNSLPYDKILSVFEDSHRQIWLTTQGGGFCRFHQETETFTCYSLAAGLPNDVVYQIVEDKDGLFWLTTNNGLVCFQPNTGAMKVYTTSNGLLGDQFNYRSSFMAEDGTIYLGSIDGFVAFNPKNFSENKSQPSIVITDFLLFGKEVYVDDPGSPLKKSITVSDELVLQSNQNSFSFRVAALNFQAPNMNRIMYKLVGFDEDWLTIGESPIITYSNLRYGNYTFRVKVSNGDGVWNENGVSLKVHILPPFYLSVWAYCIYALLIIGCSLYAVIYFKRRSNNKHRRQMEKFEQEKEREVYHAKIDFFTNVAHEIRTPLTLIKGPLENIILKKQVDAETREDLKVMEQNTERLLNLTNQLLDFRKTESQGFRLNFAKCNITEVLKETHLRFTSLAKQKGLNFTLQVPEKDFYAHVNREAFTKIISNLLNNGVKYAESYLHLSLEVPEAGNNNSFRIRTENDGVIVPHEMREEIFKPFVRYNGEEDGTVITGTGIGLALSRSLAELHQGTLTMAEGEENNTFCLTLPIVQDTTITLTPEPEVEIDIANAVFVEQTEKRDNHPTVLVTEDNPDMLAFIVRQLSKEYTVLTATNGAEALKVLDGNYVNLVISDIVMPVMDGFELCKTIKSDLNYSHIPVILLTAKTNIQSKIEGMELGADAYLEKPFSVEYLQACASNLIQNREKLRRAFAQSPFVAANTMALTKADEEFIKRLNDVIQANYANPEFSMDDMAVLLNMSRSNFYRKMKGVLDLSPNEYLRLERLKKAAQLLNEGENLVNEICYMVGFNSPSYFSKCFQKQFGALPKDFVS
ncbi:hybrid sensor histidine kinase/response regulator transcription factor [Bacteroides sp. 224]|uniref:hybrid sensor histidine kinase/response regulator transcription factor n=1 Tax=Bacteroides sp. 224 TaxID=2302936 RepID=UPI0013D15D7E|nr:hybrid sensor histidine kinase/response regulator transcription factor [Bacteroides sp. 224]NDV64142.1 response regulator [Bacteroides sp. 224]